MEINKNLLLLSGAVVVLFLFGFILVSSVNGASSTNPIQQNAIPDDSQLQIANPITTTQVNPSARSNPVAAVASISSGETQEITLSLSPDRYYNPKQIVVKQGTKIRLSADPNTLTGCMRTVVIQGYGRVTAGDTPFEFVANTSGTFRISCPMGMGSGQLIVEDQNGNIPGGNVALPTPSTAHSCGVGGVCDCGG